MKRTYLLPSSLRKELKKPFGKLILGRKKGVLKKFQEIIQKKEFKKIITVGDYCSLNLPSQVKIFDGKIRRKKIKSALLSKKHLKCKNPAGTIQKEAWEKVKKVLQKNGNLFVEGEEDLLVIPVVLLSQNKNLVAYGFPKRGICLIEVNEKSKKTFRQILERFDANKE